MLSRWQKRERRGWSEVRREIAFSVCGMGSKEGN